MTTETHTIRSQHDIDQFLDCTNSLHDAYLIGVHYAHNGLSGRNPLWIDPARTELHLRYLVTSLPDTVAELIFSGLTEWQLRDSSWDITDTAVSFDEQGRILWADDSSTAPGLRENGSYVIADSMQWRLL